MPLLQQSRRHPERSRFPGGAKDLASIASGLVGYPLLARPLCKNSSEPVDGSGIPQKPVPWAFLSAPSCPSWLKLFAVSVIFTAITLTTACRIDMHVQPRQNPLSRSDFYADQRSARQKIGNNPGDVMPFPVTKEVLARGRERFNIFCAPCHSRLGDGNGFVPSRGFPRKPPSYHIERLRKASLGYFFSVMTEGFGIMPDYASQISPQDRWDIVAYVRALPLSQNAAKADVPDGQKIPSEPPNFRDPGTGASLPVVTPESNSKSEEQQ